MSDGEAQKEIIGAGSPGQEVSAHSVPVSTTVASEAPTHTHPLAVDKKDNTTLESSKEASVESTIPASTDPLSTSEPQAAVDAETETPVDAIGADVGKVEFLVKEPGSTLVLTLLLPASGARHPYKIDEKYLAKRNVPVPGTTESGKKDPYSISVYTLKELILREWRGEWEAKPSSPSSIRLIHFGRLLDDKVTLKDCRFAIDTANVVHMTVRPQDVVDEEDAQKNKSGGREREGEESQGGCRCVIL